MPFAKLQGMKLAFSVAEGLRAVWWVLILYWFSRYCDKNETKEHIFRSCLTSKYPRFALICERFLFCESKLRPTNKPAVYLCLT
jgi:hypothetical protein